MVWANLEARAGNVAEARQLFEGAVRIDPRNAVVWEAYEEMERGRGFVTAAQRVYERAEQAVATATPSNLGMASRDGAAGGSPSAAAALPSKELLAAAEAADLWVIKQQQQAASRTAQTQRAASVRSNVEQAYGQANS